MIRYTMKYIFIVYLFGVMFKLFSIKLNKFKII